MADDEFEDLLRRCSAGLSEIRLRIPSLEAPPERRPQKYYLSAPPTLERPPEPAPEAEAEAKAGPEPEPEESEIFPPLAARARDPLPPTLPRVETPPAKTPASRPESAPATSRPWPALAALAVLGLTALGVWTVRRVPDEVQLSLDGADAMTVRPENGDVLVAHGSELLTLSRGGRTLERSAAAGGAVSLAWSQGSLWSADGRSPEVTERREGGKSTVYRLNHIPYAIFAKGSSVWTAEKGGHAFHQYQISRSILGAMLQPLDLFDVSEVSPEAFAFDDAGTLWVADDQTRSLFRMRAEKGAFKTVERAPLSPLMGPSAGLRGLAIDGDGFWILARPAEGGAAILRRIRLNRLEWSAP